MRKVIWSGLGIRRLVALCGTVYQLVNENDRRLLGSSDADSSFATRTQRHFDLHKIRRSWHKGEHCPVISDLVRTLMHLDSEDAIAIGIHVKVGKVRSWILDHG